MPEAEAGASRVPAVSRAIQVIDVVARLGPTSLADLARQLALPKSSLLAICQTLLEERLLSQDRQGRYGLGLAVAELAAAHRERPPRLRVLGVAVPNRTNPFYLAELDAFASMGKDLGVEVRAMDAGQNLDVQLAQLRTLVGQRVDAIVLDAVHSTKVAGAVRAAQEAGIPVIAVNVGAEGADATVTTDNVQAGQLVARYLADLLGGQGDVAIVDGQPVTATADRVAGFMSALREYPGVRVVARHRGDHSREAGAEIGSRIIKEHPQVAGFFGINDPTSEGVVAALAEHDMSVPVVSVDGSASAAAAIAAGGLLKATAAQDPALLAVTAFQLALRVFAGEHLPVRMRLLPTRLVTAATVNGYRGWGGDE